MGACASKPNVFDGEAPEVPPENVDAKDVGVVVNEVVNKEEHVIAYDDDAEKSPSLSNLLNNEEGKGSAEEKEETSVKSFEEDKIELEVKKLVDDDPKSTDATVNCVDEKKIEEEKSETPMEEVVKPSMENENKTNDQQKLPEEAPAEKTVEEVKQDATEDKKIEDKPAAADDLNSEVEKNKIEEKPVPTKKGKFWWDK